MGIKKAKQFIEEYAGKSISKKEISDFKDKYLAVDASLMIYQVAIALRGKVSASDYNESLLISRSIFFKILNYVQNKIIPIFVFDGRQPEIKKKTLEKRSHVKNKAKKKLAELEDRDSSSDDNIRDEKIKWAKRSFGLNNNIVRTLQEMLNLMGLPWLQSPEEADSQCAALALSPNCKVWGVISEDTDLLAFGTPYMLKDFTHKRTITQINHKIMLSELGLTFEEFIDFCILLGTEYSSSIKGLGYVTGYKKYIGIKKNIISFRKKLVSKIIESIDKDSSIYNTLLESEFDNIAKEFSESDDIILGIFVKSLTLLNESVLDDKFSLEMSIVTKWIDLNIKKSISNLENIFMAEAINSILKAKKDSKTKRVELLVLLATYVKNDKLTEKYVHNLDLILDSLESYDNYITLFNEDRLLINDNSSFVMHVLLADLKKENEKFINIGKKKKYFIPSEFLNDWKNAKKYYLEATVVAPETFSTDWGVIQDIELEKFLTMNDKSKSSKMKHNIRRLNELKNNIFNISASKKTTRFSSPENKFPVCFSTCARLRKVKKI